MDLIWTKTECKLSQVVGARPALLLLLQNCFLLSGSAGGSLVKNSEKLRREAGSRRRVRDDYEQFFSVFPPHFPLRTDTTTPST
uniref:Putative secreted protein n=1 Tax=Anopheles darlingi TaxID=43151 RepID=A0A2M4DCF3_ANODA